MKINVCLILYICLILAGCNQESSELGRSQVVEKNQILFSLADSSTLSKNITFSRIVTIILSKDSNVSQWCVSEAQASIPQDSCEGGQGESNGWHNSRPASFELSEGDEVKNIYLWVRDKNKNLIFSSGFIYSIELNESPPVLTLNDLPSINQLNVNQYELMGDCDEGGRVDIKVGLLEFNTQCRDTNKWIKVVDLSEVSDGSVSIKVETTDSSNLKTSVAKVVTKNVTIPALTVNHDAQINNTNVDNFSFSGTCTDDEEIQVSGAVNTIISCNSGVFNVDYNMSSLSEDILEFNFQLEDSEENLSETITRSIRKDTELAALNLLSPNDGDFIVESNMNSYVIQGECNEEGQDVIISGDANLDLNCENSEFSGELNLSSLPEGIANFTIEMDDRAEANTAQINFSLNKDTVAPDLTQTMIESPSFSSQDTTTLGGSCNSTDGNVIISGEQSAEVDCTADSWSYTTSAITNDGNYNYTISQTDDAGNITSVYVTWNRDTVAPILNSIVLAEGKELIGSSYALVDLAVDDWSENFYIRLSNANSDTGDCQSEYADDNWQDYNENQTQFTHSLFVGDGLKKVCVWAKDYAGNVTVISPSQGEEGVTMDTVLLQVGSAPVVSSFNVTNSTAGDNFGTQVASVGDSLRIEWSVSDSEELAEGPVSLYYTTSSSANAEFTTIIEDYGSIGENQTEYTGNYLDFTSPASSYFRLKIIAKDNVGNTSLSAEVVFNTGNWSVFAGTVDRGIGGSLLATRLRHASNAVSNFSVAVDPTTNNVYAVDYGYGIYKGNVVTGKTEMFIKHGGTVNFVHGSTLNSDSQVPTDSIGFHIDKNGMMYLMESTGNYSAANIWQINLSTLEIKKYLGGGDKIDNTATVLNAHVLYGAFNLDESNSLYYLASCDPSLSYVRDAAADPGLRLMKVTQNSSTKEAETVSVVAGDCTRGNPTTGVGVDALTSPLVVNGAYANLASMAIWDNGEKIIYCLHGSSCFKINNGTTYRANLSNSGIYYDHDNDTLYKAQSNEIKVVTADFSSSDSDVLNTYVKVDGTGECYNDGVDRAQTCAGSYFPPFRGPDGTVAFQDGAYLNAPSTYSVRYVRDDDKLQTIMGTRPFYGDGLAKEFIKSDISGIYYKKATELNQTAFPSGLYFIDKSAMALAYIDDSNQTTLIAGNQTKSGIASDGDPFDTTVSLGQPYGGGIFFSLDFDDQGLPWMRSSSNSKSYMRVMPDLTIDYLTDDSGVSNYFEEAETGDNPRLFGAWVNGGINNLTLKGSDKLFVFGAYRNGTSRSHVLGAEMKLFDFGSDQVTHIMGDYLEDADVTNDQATAGLLEDKTFSSICRNVSHCFMDYNNSQDRLYFSEHDKLRYITEPENPVNSTLVTLLTADRDIKNYIFSEDGTQLFYVSGGELYCYDISSGAEWCDDTSLGPEAGMLSISNGPNQMTWKDSSTLLISTFRGMIYQYNITP